MRVLMGVFRESPAVPHLGDALPEFDSEAHDSWTRRALIADVGVNW